jgi:AcrR family transcriptional regulator
MSPRPYTLGRRAEAAAETRSRVLAAARAIIAGGEKEFTVDAVSAKAGVARMTVYYQFASKRGLLEALFDDLASAGGIEQLAAAFRNTEPLQGLATIIGTFVGFWASDRPLLRRLRALAALDDELRQAIDERDERRRRGLMVILQRVAARRGMSPQTDLEEIADLLHTFTSFETYDSLASAGWDPDRIARAMTDLAFDALGLDSGSGRNARPGKSRRVEGTHLPEEDAAELAG